MAYLLTPHPLPTRLAAASSSSVSLKRVLPPLACHARNLFDVLPQSDGNSDVVANGNPPRTEKGGAGSVSVPRTMAQGGVTREASLSASQGRNCAARRWIRRSDRLVLGESPEGGVVQKGWTGGHGSTGGSEGRGRGRRWMRGGMRVQEPVKAVNLATSGEDRGVGNVSKRGKRSKGGERGVKLRVELDMCSKRGDVMGAIDLYDSAVKEGVRMGQHHYNVLLYLCSSAALGTVQPAKSGTKLDSASAESSGYSEDNNMHEDHVHDQERNKFNLFRLEETTSGIPISDEIKEYARTRGFEIFDKMRSEKQRVLMSEAALTAVARMAMSMGNGDMAFETVKQMKELGIAPKLRSYGPALTAFCSSGDVDKAFEVEAHMLESGVIPEEPELGMLLSASVVARQGDRVYYLLHKFRTTVRQVSQSTAKLLEAWFSSSTASKVGKRKWDSSVLAEAIENNGGGWHGLGWLGRGKWIITRSHIDKNGVCLACGEKLAIIDLDPKETEDFATMVAKLALKRVKNSNFEKFQKWLEKHGPFDAVMDAANVGLSQSHLSLSKVSAIADATQKRFPSRKWPLIVVHNRHLAGKHMKNPANQKLVQKWKQANAVYETPTGSNDDWYWLFAAIRWKCLMITNDEMRDHTFQLLEKDFFPKWKERHQESEKGHWHIPVTKEGSPDGEQTWLCMTRRNHMHNIMNQELIQNF
ncbi:proteinaceous RNase P 1, chloroplastic/mitochondrial-like isoform X2 [Lolium rigidum]|uniref:proteinaceous RNase P 1, chloroplastic/mitochondrial-like isoform X2 n=1 Tax=Lolium rigidum TaxID=89674 RepID=UPI001F5CF0E4|nr:proteinaceous RNase P 1, chloroplastic/mitochondrial-like isoform X2 [Lolium rigidum]